MNTILKFILGIVCFMLGLGYLYRPDLISRLNTLLKESLLNDSYIALERRKWGMFFLLMAFLLFYMSYSAHVSP